MTGLRRQSRLPNGLTIVSERVDTVRSVALGIWVRAGSRYEPPHLAGISHFLEHTVFKGTTSRNTYAIASALEDVGGSVNAFTSKEYTCYHARFLSEYLERGIDLLSDLLLHPIFPEAEVTREREVVLDELRDSQDVPEEVVFEAFDTRMFPETPLGKPVIGRAETIRGFTPELLASYLKEHYGPENTIIVAAGFVDHDELVELITQRYEAVETGMGRVAPDGPAAMVPGVYSDTKDIQQCHMILGCRTFSNRDERRWALAVLNAILSGGMSSRLFQNIREARGVAYQVFSFANLFADIGSFGVYLATDPEKRELAEELVHTELQRLADEPVSDIELERVKAQYKSGVVMADESMERRMLRLGRQQVIYGRNMNLDEFMSRIESVTAMVIQELARELFRKEQYLTMILEPQNGDALS